MELHGISSREDIALFLEELKNILKKKGFSPDKDLFMPGDRTEAGKKNMNTMFALDYDLDDVCEVLLALKLREYSHTLPDRNQTDPLRLFVFGKNVLDHDLYVKSKVLPEAKMVKCISFHDQENELEYPYCKEVKKDDR